MNNALPGFAALNAWFKKVAGAVIANHGEQDDTPQILWITPSGVKARQCYIEEEVTVTRSYTHGDIRKNRYVQVTEHSDGKRDKKTRERAKRLLSSKMRTALAANVVHSLDASILHLALKDFTSGPFTANHDCVYAPSGGLKRLTDAVKLAFKEVVGGQFLMDFLSFNDLEEDDELVSLLRTMTYSNDDIIDGITESQYLFC
jgi:DNA-directed RNA polymerase